MESDKNCFYRRLSQTRGTIALLQNAKSVERAKTVSREGGVS